jgi:hypothetical protein
MVQFLIKVDAYIELLKNPLVNLILHAVLLANTYFLLSGEKYYNENLGVE